MFYLEKIINKSLIKERCFLSTHVNSCYEFIDSNIEINSKYFFVEKVNIYTNLIINFENFDNLIDLIHELTNLYNKSSNQKVLIDYFGVNFGKLVHFGHLRTLIYGNLINKLYKFVGINVLSDTHFGDSNIHLSKYIYHFKINNYSLINIDNISISDMNNIYIQVKNFDEYNNSIIKDIFNNIGKKDTFEFQVREKIVNTSISYIKNILKKLHIYFDFMYSESRYYTLCNFLVNFGLENKLFKYDENRRLITNNNIVLTNSNGEFLYAFVDIATIIERKLMGITKIIYVVDKRQSLHFKLLFDFIKNIFNIDLIHIKYGYIYNNYNKIISSRSSLNVDILNFISQYEQKGYSIYVIKFALYLYEIKHRMQSDYLFLENIFIDVLNEAKIFLNKLNDIENIVIKKKILNIF